jgi:hypothetical protein
MVLEKLPTYGCMELDPYLTPYKRIKSKWIKALHIRTETFARRKQKGKFP